MAALIYAFLLFYYIHLPGRLCFLSTISLSLSLCMSACFYVFVHFSITLCHYDYNHYIFICLHSSCALSVRLSRSPRPISSLPSCVFFCTILSHSLSVFSMDVNFSVISIAACVPLIPPHSPNTELSPAVFCLPHQFTKPVSSKDAVSEPRPAS